MDKKALKLVRLEEKAITVLTTTEQYIVAGDSQGHIRFLNQNLQLINWYQDLHLGPLTSVSFKFIPELDNSITQGYPTDTSIKPKPFIIRDFVVGTATACYGSVTTRGTDIKVIRREHDGGVHAVACHPSESILAIGSHSGFLQVWNFEKKTINASRSFDHGLSIQCCSFDPKGQLLAVGFTNGSLRLLDAVSLRDTLKQPIRYSRDAITHVTFSHDSEFIATADEARAVTVLARSCDKKKGLRFVLFGRYKAHYKPIQDILFGVKLDSDFPRLLSVGMDRHLVEYDLEKTTDEGLYVMSSDRIEQTAVPCCMVMYPPVTKESFILTANDQYKLKLYNSTTKVCRHTFLGPTFGGHLKRLLVLPCADPVNDTQHVVYVTDDKVGVQMLPLDGNPHKSMAMIAHPHGVSNFACSHDGRYLFTSGGSDMSVHMWNINLEALEAQRRLGGDDLIPFYGLIEGGRDGEFFHELEDYFYYAQIRSQGINTMNKREVSTTIPISEIPFVMRAMGFYPTEQQVEEMINEVKFGKYVETGEYTTQIDIGDFLKLYINHRPTFGLELDKLSEAFQVLGAPSEGGYSIDRAELLNLLQNKGEAMTEAELSEYLFTLLGFSEEGGSCELQQLEEPEVADVIDRSLPQNIDTGVLLKLLGFTSCGGFLPENAATAVSSHEDTVMT